MIRRGCLPAIMLAALSGCGFDVEVPTPGPTPTDLEGAAPLVLPGPSDLLPTRVAAAADWIGTSSHPDGFDPQAARATPDALADAFALAVSSSFAGGAQRPQLSLALVQPQPDGRVLLVVSETGLADDSVAGTQYALVAVEDADGWVLDELYTRPLCVRGASGNLCV